MRRGPLVGSSSLLVSLALVCLTVFALLSLSTARNRRALTEASVESLYAYYAADTWAQTEFARLRLEENRQTRYTYQTPISEHLTLVVELERRGDRWVVLRWQSVPTPPAPGEELDVWDGQQEEKP